VRVGNIALAVASAIVVLLGSGCASADPVAVNRGDIRILAEGDQSNQRTRRVIVAASRENGREIDALIGTELDLEGAGFEDGVVVAAFAGEKPTAGYDIRIVEVRSSGSTVTIVLSIDGPGPGEMAATVLTTPYLAFAVPTDGAEVRVEWEEP
jgi:hypothetical protein